jgi:site-specific recombinase XerD
VQTQVAFTPETLRPAISKVVDSVKGRVTKSQYANGLTDFTAWLSREPSSEIDQNSVAGYREFLKQQGFAPSTINQRLSAIKKLAIVTAEMSLTPVHSLRQILHVACIRVPANGFDKTLEQGEIEALLNAPDAQSLKGARDKAILALLVGCGLRRHEITSLDFDQLAQRNKHLQLAITNVANGRDRIVEVPTWAATTLFHWLSAANITDGKVFRALHRYGRVSGISLSQQAVLDVVRAYGRSIGKDVRPNDLRRTCKKMCLSAGAALGEVNELLGYSKFGPKSDSFHIAPNTRFRVRLQHVPSIRPKNELHPEPRLLRTAP